MTSDRDKIAFRRTRRMLARALTYPQGEQREQHVLRSAC